MKFIFFVTFLFSFIDLFSQQIEKRIVFTIDSSYYDNSMTKSDEIELEHKVLKTNIIDTSTNKIIAEFLRLNDATYLFRKFDSLGNVETEGKVILSNKILESYKIPFYNSLGKFIRSKLIKIHNFEKVGKWYERVNDSIQRYGTYDNSVKTGKWIYLKKLSNFNSIEEKQELYVRGKMVNSSRSNLFEIDNSNKIQTLLGRWNLNTDLRNIAPDSIIQFSKISRLESSNCICYLNFISQDRCEMYVPGGHHYGSKTYVCNLEIYKNRIIISIPEIDSIIEVNYLSRNTMLGIFKVSE